MPFLLLLITTILSATSVVITEPVDGESYNGDWLTIRAIVDNENTIPDSVNYSLNGEPVIGIPRLNTDWPTYMQNYQNHGYSQSPAPMDNSILWTAPVTGTIQEAASPVVVDGIVYYAQHTNGDSLFALNAATGEIIWKYRVGHTSDAVTVADGWVYSASNSIYCLDAVTGQLKWVSDLGDKQGGTPVVQDGFVYCGSNNWAPDILSYISCLNADTGDPVWTDTLPGFCNSCMALSGDRLFLPTHQAEGPGPLYAIDIITGDVVWQNLDNDKGFWGSSPVVVDGVIYINSYDGSCMGIDEFSGETIWQVKISYGTIVSATPAYHDDILYFADIENEFYALSADDGKDIWSTPGTQSGSPGIADGIVFYGERFDIYKARVNALDCQDGNLIWFYETSARYIQSSPAITDGIVYIAGMDGNLFAFGTGLKYTYREDFFYATIGSNELIVTSFDDGLVVAADTINFTVTQTGINLQPSRQFGLSVAPNPFHSSASISFELSDSGFTKIEIFDLAGRSVSMLANHEIAAGTQTILWNGTDQNGDLVSAGLYLCRIQSGAITGTIGLCLLR